MSFDQDLRRALRSENPPEGFEERVVQAIRRRPAAADVERSVSERLPGRRAVLAVAASVLVAVAASRYYIGRQTAAEAARVQQDVTIALRIASEKLTEVQLTLKQLGLREF